MQAWAESLGGIESFPLLSDFWPHGAVAERYGVLRDDGVSERALFLIDKDGCIRYIDIHDIDEQPDNEVLIAELCRIDPEAAQNESRLREVEDAPLPHGGIVMYCTAWCSDCKQARQWLQAHDLPFQEVNITHTRGARRQLRAWAGGNLTTPTFDIDGEVIVGFDEARLREVLAVK